jgi:hypothetical protein
MSAIEKLANPTPAELADRMEAWLASGLYKPGDIPPSSMQASIGALVCQHMPMILAALRSADALDLGRSAFSETIGEGK